MPSQFVDYYEILGLKQKDLLGKNDSQVKRSITLAYRDQALIHHPDRDPGTDGERIRNLHHAREIMSDPEQRAEYDERYGVYVALGREVFDDYENVIDVIQDIGDERYRSGYSPYDGVVDMDDLLNKLLDSANFRKDFNKYVKGKTLAELKKSLTNDSENFFSMVEEQRQVRRKGNREDNRSRQFRSREEENKELAEELGQEIFNSYQRVQSLIISMKLEGLVHEQNRDQVIVNSFALKFKLKEESVFREQFNQYIQKKTDEELKTILRNDNKDFFSIIEGAIESGLGEESSYEDSDNSRDDLSKILDENTFISYRRVMLLIALINLNNNGVPKHQRVSVVDKSLLQGKLLNEDGFREKFHKYVQGKTDTELKKAVARDSERFFDSITNKKVSKLTGELSGPFVRTMRIISSLTYEGLTRSQRVSSVMLLKELETNQGFKSKFLSEIDKISDEDLQRLLRQPFEQFKECVESGFSTINMKDGDVNMMDLEEIKKQINLIYYNDENGYDFRVDYDNFMEHIYFTAPIKELLFSEIPNSYGHLRDQFIEGFSLSSEKKDFIEKFVQDNDLVSIFSEKEDFKEELSLNKIYDEVNKVYLGDDFDAQNVKHQSRVTKNYLKVMSSLEELLNMPDDNDIKNNFLSGFGEAMEMNKIKGFLEEFFEDVISPTANISPVGNAKNIPGVEKYGRT